MKRFTLFFHLVLQIPLCLCLISPGGAQTGKEQVQVDDVIARLCVDGNQIVRNDNRDVTVRLTGLNIPSLEWSNHGEHVFESLEEAHKNWNCNVIRIPLSVARWFGCEQWQTSPQDYRDIVAALIAKATEKHIYVILDCHWSNGGQGDLVRRSDIKNTGFVRSLNGQKSMPDEEVLEFWLEIAKLYGNNPAVLFNLYNEPKGVSWEVWRNGGSVTENLFDFETKQAKPQNYKAVGHQQLVEAIRDAGAKNLLVVGGLDWGYDLRGVVGLAGDGKDYRLVDRSSDGDPSKTGYGIIYDTHIYPWKGDVNAWENAVGEARKQFPVIAGECGWDWETIRAIRPSTDLLKEPHLDHPRWVPSLLNWFDDITSETGIHYGNQIHWTGWCFHPSASPRLITSWDYTPTPFWGKYVKERLQSYRKDVANH
jgi:hypothetical protein